MGIRTQGHRWIILAILGTAASLGCLLWASSQTREHSRSGEISDLRQKAASQTVPRDDRMSAISKLGEIGGSESVAALLSLLPGDWDVVTGKVIDTLGQVGDPAAIPKFREMLSTSSREFRIPDQIATSLFLAIERLEKRGSEVHTDAGSGGM